MLHLFSLIYLFIGILVALAFWVDPVGRARVETKTDGVIFTLLIILFWPIGLLEIRDELRR